MIDNRTVGRTIATLRQAKGMTQQQLAAAMNVSHQAVSKWENGAALPDIQTLVGLTQLFGITVEQLLNGEIPEARLEEEKLFSFGEHFQNVGNFVGNVIDDLGNMFKAEPAEKQENEPAQPNEEENRGEQTEEDKTIDLQELLEMAPFMSKGTVSEMLGKCGRKLTPAEIARFAPFVDAACLEKLICECESEITWDSLRRLAPFLKKEAVDAFARTIALGEKYVKPASAEVNRMAEDVWKNLDDVSRKIEKGVDKAVRKVVKMGESVVNEVTRAFDDLAGETMTRDERLAKLRRSAFERALEDGRWDWLAAHIGEIQDEELRRRISETANRQGMQDWVFEYMGGYADPETIDKAVAEGDWAWLGEHIEEFDGITQRRVAQAAVQAQQWDWLSACAEQIELDELAGEVAGAARRAGEKMLAAQLVRYDMQPEQVRALVAEAVADGDDEFIGMIVDMVSGGTLRSCCVQLAASGEWENVIRVADKLDLEGVEELMETAIGTGNFEAVDLMDALLKEKEIEEEKL